MPKASSADARRLASLSHDCSFLLTHLVRQHGTMSDDQAREILIRILGLDTEDGVPFLKGSRTGWYSAADATVFNPGTQQFEAPGEVRAVCFTESTLAGLRAHRDVFDIKYGLAFDRDALYAKGANPCLNIRQDLFKKPIQPRSGDQARRLLNFVPKELLPFINIIHEGFDATHEREWRYAGHMPFAYPEVRFVFCPEEEFETFIEVQKVGQPVLFDLKWLDRV